ncbi:MAG: SufD family Fe-S cluster assembly protein [Clostridiales bacterium]|nr:SufD family Fe-S cluster assembly protein [Clostridiales bacterium]
MNNDIRINVSPALTFSWLNINDDHIRLESGELSLLDPKTVIPEGISVSEDAASWSRVKAGCGIDTAALISDVKGDVPLFETEKDRSYQKPVVFNIKADRSGVYKAVIKLAAGSELTVIEHVESDIPEGLAAVSVKYILGKGARLNLIKSQILGDKFIYIDDMGAELEETAVFEVYRTDLGALKAYQGCNTVLAGKSAFFSVLASYYLRGSQLLDVNYVAVHEGRKTESDMRFNGVLKDDSMKTFRGTLDFKSGCSGAVGAENEDVMLLTDGVVNRSLPIILCGEEDVTGEHGASVGQISDDILFYLMSRGFSREACENMLINSRLNTTISRISDEGIRDSVVAYLKNNLNLRSIDEE